MSWISACSCSSTKNPRPSVANVLLMCCWCVPDLGSELLSSHSAILRSRSKVAAMRLSSSSASSVAPSSALAPAHHAQACSTAACVQTQARLMLVGQHAQPYACILATRTTVCIHTRHTHAYANAPRTRALAVSRTHVHARANLEHLTLRVRGSRKIEGAAG